MTTETTLNPLARMADERRKTLKLLARSANLSHRWAAAAAGAAIAHTVAAGHALVQARELCEEGGWLRWLRKNFKGSIRTAQRYVRVARNLPASGIDATRVSHGCGTNGMPLAERSCQLRQRVRQRRGKRRRCPTCTARVALMWRSSLFSERSEFLTLR